MKQLTKQAARRILAEAKKRSSTTQLNLADLTFPEQLAFIKDSARFKTACLNRRAGKTSACALDLISTAAATPKIVCLYITLTRVNAKNLVWNMLLDLNRELKLNAQPNLAELCLTLPNGSRIYATGAKDSASIEKFRGMALKKVYIDEAQSFKSYIKSLIDDILVPALRDHKGSLILTGTPGPVPQGYFFEACQPNSGFSNHQWTGEANIYMLQKSGETWQEQLNQELTRLNTTIDNPTIQREWFGRWVLDLNKVVFKYNANLNNYAQLPTSTAQWNYVMGIDVGFNDADAIAILGWQQHSKQVYLIEESVVKKQGITELANTITQLYNKYNPQSVVMDPGGGGKKIIEEMKQRYSIPIKPAEKTQKLAHILLLNDSLQTGNFFARSDSNFAQDAALVEWELPLISISDRYHSDILDATLYSFRECQHWLEIPNPKSNKKSRLIEEETEVDNYWEMEDLKEALKQKEEFEEYFNN